MYVSMDDTIEAYSKIGSFQMLPTRSGKPTVSTEWHTLLYSQLNHCIGGTYHCERRWYWLVTTFVQFDVAVLIVWGYVKFLVYANCVLAEIIINKKIKSKHLAF